ncbi:MAG: hypothetical protein D6826_09015 [Alphaproteobacteria bacterium]|nr:MAG: hypothetical protein D6826_09015 [Alphaproteobacteria bacterium]
MDDLSQRDLSQIADADLTPEERNELKRRFHDFVDRLRARHGRAGTRARKAKRVMRWNPATFARRR